ncbi:MAG: NHL repeat-containing protein [Dehalococcoidia bacterium]
MTEADPQPRLVWLVTTHSGDAVARYDSGGRFIDSIVALDSSPLREPRGMAIGPDGHLYVVSAHASKSEILQFDGRTGAFITVFARSNGLKHPYSLAFAPSDSPAHGSLLVTSQDNSVVSRFDAHTGQAEGILIERGSGGLAAPRLGAFGPDHHFYVASRDSHAILRFHGKSGRFIDEFVTRKGGRLSRPIQFAWGPDGHHYVGSEDNHKVLRHHGRSGRFQDIFVDGAAPAGGGLRNPSGIAFGPLDGNLYVASRTGGQILRYDGRTGEYLDVFIDSIPDPATGTPIPLKEPEFILPCFMTPAGALRAVEPSASQ